MKYKGLYTIALFASILGGIGAASGGNGGGRLQYTGFSGGMMLHSGYLRADGFDVNDADGNMILRQKMHGLPTGIGGSAKLHFGKHLRVGMEGYVSTLGYGDFGSYATIGTGGLSVDAIWQCRAVSPFVGATFGGGSVKNITFTAAHTNDFKAEQGVSFRKYAFAAISPFAGFEVTLNPSVRLLFKADYMINVSKYRSDFPQGIRVFAGFMFYRTAEKKR